MSKKTKAHTRYRLADKTIVPGVTTILGVLNKPALVKWSNNLGLKGIDVSKYVDDKADIGTLGHAIVTDSLISRVTDFSDYSKNQIDLAQNCALSFYEWQKQHDVKVIWVERPLVHEEMKYGGTADIYAVVDGVLELIDLKTGKGIYPEHIYQLAALSELLDWNEFDVKRCRVINIPRAEDEVFVERVCKPEELEVGWGIFTHCLAIYNLRKE